MAKHTGPPESGADNAAGHAAENPADAPHRDSAQDFNREFDPDADSGSALPPARFGRLALWAASAGALTLGVAATVAYGVWFDQDQRTYAKAMAVAQQTLSAGVAVAPEPQTLPASPSPSAAAPAQQTAWTGHVALAAPPANPSSTLADAPAVPEADPATTTSLAGPESSDAASADSAAPQPGARPPQAISHGAKQERHRPAPRAKPNGGLFARMESFFHRVSYRQHGNGSQRDIYSHS
ncbi:MAG: hypothetical protein RXR20_34090 [Paraburkholderia sp.]|jgi:hypothetical protein|uniref:hypothetical protein n=1 Tax=Burkholderiaceae TaxID=119060 RepID=UPI0010F4D058|nr:hypothetical protein [Burkholderia sp. 4M9327F10]